MFDDNSYIHQSFYDTNHYDNFKDRISTMRADEQKELADRLGVELNPNDPAEVQADALKNASWKDFKYAYRKATGTDY